MVPCRCEPRVVEPLPLPLFFWRGRRRLRGAFFFPGFFAFFSSGFLRSGPPVFYFLVTVGLSNFLFCLFSFFFFLYLEQKRWKSTAEEKGGGGLGELVGARWSARDLPPNRRCRCRCSSKVNRPAAQMPVW